MSALQKVLVKVSMAAALLVASLAMATFGSGSSRAARRGATEVRVVNGPSRPIPAAVTSLPAVAVSELPAVQVSRMPAIKVSNNVGDAIPVRVLDVGEAFHQQVDVVLGAEGGGVDDQLLTKVPDGMRLVIEQISGEFWDKGEGDPKLVPTRLVFIRPDVGWSQVVYARDGLVSQTLNVSFDAGEEVWFETQTMTGVPVTTNVDGHVWISGHLVPTY